MRRRGESGGVYISFGWSAGRAGEGEILCD